MTITLGDRQMTPFFSSTFWALFLNFKIQFHGVHSLHYDLVCKIQINMLKMVLLSLLTLISFFFRKFANFWYVTCSLSLIPIWFLSHGLWIPSCWGHRTHGETRCVLSPLVLLESISARTKVNLVSHLAQNFWRAS